MDINFGFQTIWFCVLFEMKKIKLQDFDIGHNRLRSSLVSNNSRTSRLSQVSEMSKLSNYDRNHNDPNNTISNNQTASYYSRNYNNAHNTNNNFNNTTVLDSMPGARHGDLEDYEYGMLCFVLV